MHFNSFLKLCMCHARGALKGHSRPPLTYTMAPNVAVIKFASTFFSKSPTNGNILETHAHTQNTTVTAHSRACYPGMVTFSYVLNWMAAS